MAFDGDYTRKQRAEQDTPTKCCGEGVGMGSSEQSAKAYRPNPRHLIEGMIDLHNRKANGLHALLRALPVEMAPEAEHALFTVLTERL